MTTARLVIRKVNLAGGPQNQKSLEQNNIEMNRTATQEVPVVVAVITEPYELSVGAARVRTASQDD